jgi:predicted transcriptional regulator
MGRRAGRANLTPLELEVMDALWELGSANVEGVRRRLASRRALAYTTVQTVLNLLHEKGKLHRVLRDRAYHYRPAVTRRREAGRALRELAARFFGGSAEALVLNMVEDRQLGPEALARLQKAVAAERDER